MVDTGVGEGRGRYVWISVHEGPPTAPYVGGGVSFTKGGADKPFVAGGAAQMEVPLVVSCCTTSEPKLCVKG